MQLELGDDATYQVTGMSSTFFQMPPNVLKLHHALFVPSLTNNILSISIIIDMKCMVEFDDQRCTFRDKCDPLLAEGMQEGGLCRFFTNKTKNNDLVHDSDKF